MKSGNPLNVEQEKERIKNAGAETASNMIVEHKDDFYKYTGTAYTNINAMLIEIEKNF